jgi:hypothetical protein
MDLLRPDLKIPDLRSLFHFPMEMVLNAVSQEQLPSRDLQPPSKPIPGTRPVPRLSGSEARSYLRQRVLPDTPVIFTDVMQEVPAMTKWTPAFFKSRYPQITVDVEGRKVTLREQLQYIVDSTEERPAPYPFSFSIAGQAPELLGDLAPFVSFGRSDRTVHPWMLRPLLNGTVVHELFFGGRGSAFPHLHYDVLGMNTQITQVLGEKEFFLFDPSQTPFLYPDPLSPRVSTLNSIFSPDLERFPLFSQAKPTSVMLLQGETLYFPRGWWHVTRIHGPSITYGRAVVNASNWNLMMHENRDRWRSTQPLLALPGFMLGKAWGGMFRMMEMGR